MTRHYTDDEKRLVLDRLIANHGDVPRTATECGMNKRTLYLWLEDPKFTDVANEIAQVKMKNVKNFVKNDPASLPSPVTMGEGPGGRGYSPTETTAAFQTLHDKLLAIADTLSNRIVESIDEAPLNQRMTALSQLIDRIAKLAALLPAEDEKPSGKPFEIDFDVEVKKDEDDKEETDEVEQGYISPSARSASLSN